jgi:DNA-binding GntR family transcriptional regulator
MLLEAIRRRDADGAAEVAEKHMWASRDVRLDMIREAPDEMGQG